jgi:hypothetical protein
MVALGAGTGATETIAAAAVARFSFENTYRKKREVVRLLQEQSTSGA